MQETESPSGSGTARSISLWQDARMLSKYKRRKIKSKATTVLAVLSVIVVLYPLLDILGVFVYRGVLAISIPRLTLETQDGGLANALVGTSLLVGLSTIISVPLGVLGGIYLAEFSRTGKYAGATRFVADVLSAMPSILLGYFGFLIFVTYFGWGFSPLAGALTLSFLMLPYIFRTTERSLRRVPTNIREAAVALGSRKTQVLNRLALKLAMPGILTGILLSISISLGETAPLLYTADFYNFYPCGLTQCRVGYLTYLVYSYTNTSSYVAVGADSLAYLSVFLLLAFTVVINLVARIGLRRMSKI